MLKISVKNQLIFLCVLLIVGCMVGRQFATAITFSYGKKQRPRAVIQTQIQHCKEIIKQAEVRFVDAVASMFYLPLSDIHNPISFFLPFLFSHYPFHISSQASPRAPPQRS